ncbi:GNAT family acetyltransferase [Enterococcus sp. JM4C]|uniref:GNAT family N-acetyltransferase n=1 Tax=Candidatus Enterococcus huntleyi TaxID=1857217 RepID=UPI001379F327|nr:GNAT family N-acetyltransferase [Enterococcus sp. JM4C]KAF1299554.1 GNAT family acetyltransferase [Enterococcus sp. JM4C]
MTIKEIDYNENREATLAELDNYTQAILPELANESKSISFYYEEEGTILGRIVGFLHWDHIQIECFFVSEEARGKGIGLSLFAKVEELAKENKVAYILLETMSFNAPRFYENIGFKRLATIKDSPVKNEHRYFYLKEYQSRE